jgi:hypothetical protein
MGSVEVHAPFKGLLDIRSSEFRARQVIEMLKSYPENFKTDLGNILISPQEKTQTEPEMVDESLADEVLACVNNAEYVRNSSFFRPSRSKYSLKFFRNI